MSAARSWIARWRPVGGARPDDASVSDRCEQLLGAPLCRQQCGGSVTLLHQPELLRRGGVQSGPGTSGYAATPSASSGSSSRRKARQRADSSSSPRPPPRRAARAARAGSRGCPAPPSARCRCRPSPPGAAGRARGGTPRARTRTRRPGRRRPGPLAEPGPRLEEGGVTRGDRANAARRSASPAPASAPAGRRVHRRAPRRARCGGGAAPAGRQRPGRRGPALQWIGAHRLRVAEGVV